MTRVDGVFGTRNPLLPICSPTYCPDATAIFTPVAATTPRPDFRNC